MKKRTLLSMALLATAITAGSMPLTAQAAGLTKVASATAIRYISVREPKVCTRL